MKKSRVLKLGAVGLPKLSSVNKKKLILTLIFFAGIFFGVCVCSKSENVLDFSSDMFSYYIGERSGKEFWTVTFSSFGFSMLFISALCIAGTSMLGIALTPLIVFTAGFLPGIITAFLYKSFALKGVVFNTMVFIPPTVISSIAMLAAASEAVRLSQLMAALTFANGQSRSLFEEFKSYCIRFSLLLIAVLFSAICDAAVSHFFIDFFDLTL